MRLKFVFMQNNLSVVNIFFVCCDAKEYQLRQIDMEMVKVTILVWKSYDARATMYIGRGPSTNRWNR